MTREVMLKSDIIRFGKKVAAALLQDPRTLFD